MGTRTEPDSRPEVVRPPTFSPTGAPFTLRELMAQEHLGLTLCAGGEESLDRRISGAHPIEVEHPSQWMSQDWVMLTTGTRLVGDPKAQRALIRELAEAGMCALGFAEEVIFESTPPELIDEAQEVGFPVFAVPYRTPFRDVVMTTNQALLSTELRSTQRLASIQGYLIDSMREQSPREALIERLGRVLGVAVIHVPPAGQEHRPSSGPSSIELASVLHRLSPTAQEVEVGPWHILAVPIENDDGEVEWLAAASRRSSFVNALTKPTLQAAGPLLVATARLDRAVRLRDRATRSALLHDILAYEHDHTERQTLRTRAEAFGFQFDRPVQVLTVGLAGASFDALAALLQRSSAPWLALPDEGGRAIVMVEGAEDERRVVIDCVTDHLAQARVGGGRTFETLGSVGASRDDSLHALEQLEESGAASRYLAYTDFDLPSLILREIPKEKVTPKLDAITQVLQANPSIHLALVTYFKCNMDVTAAATALYLHPNSMRYRLQRAEALLGYSLKDPAGIMALYVALDRIGPPDHSPEQESP